MRCWATVVFALAAICRLSGATPWGFAVDSSGAETPLTTADASGRARLTDVPAGTVTVRFTPGTVAVAAIALTNRTLRFCAGAGGTTLTTDGRTEMFALGGWAGEWTFEGLTFVGADLREPIHYRGGAISCRGGRLAVSGCTFRDLKARFAGGAVCARMLDGDSAFADCVFEGNFSGPLNGTGGAVYATGSRDGVALTLSGCTFGDNAAQSGGAVSTACTDDEAERPVALSVSGGAFVGNCADYNGGALLSAGSLSLTNVLFRGNASGVQGGAVCVGAMDAASESAVRVTLRDGTRFVGNVVSNASVWTCGGAIALVGGGVLLEVLGREVDFEGNAALSGDAGYGGAVFADFGTEAIVDRTAFLANRAETGGGALFSWGGTLDVSTSIFSNNTVTAANGFGGAVSAEEASLDMRNCTVRGSNGGAVDAYRAKATLVNCVVVDNETTDISVGGGAGAVLVAEYTSYGRAEVAEATPVTTNACLSGRDKSIYLGESLYLDSLGIYLLEAYEGIEQDARDYDGVKYELPPSGGAMGAYETPTGRLLATVSGSRRYDGTTDGPKTLSWTLVNMYGSPVTLPGLADLANLFDVKGWRFGSPDVNFYSSASEVPEKKVYLDYSVKPGAYALHSDMISVVAEGSILKRPLKFRSADAEKPYDTLPLERHEVYDVSGEAFDAPCGLVAGETVFFDVTGSQTEVGSSPNWFTVLWTGTALSSNYELVLEYGTLTVTKRDSSEGLRITYPDPHYYGGTNICPAVTVALTNGLGQVVSNLVEGVDFTVAYFDNLNAFDSPYLVVTPNGNFAGGALTNAFTILPRKVTFRSADAEKEYDALPLTTNEVTWTKQDEAGPGTGILRAEEGFLSFDVTGSQTEVGTSPNDFEIIWGEGISPRNYDVTVEYGTLTVTPSRDPLVEIVSTEWYHNRADGLYYPRIVLRFLGGDASRITGFSLWADGVGHELPAWGVAELRTAVKAGQEFAFGVDPEKFEVSHIGTEHDGYIVWSDPEEKERLMLFGAYRTERPLKLELEIDGELRSSRTAKTEARAMTQGSMAAGRELAAEQLVQGVKFCRTLTDVPEPKVTASGLPSGVKVVATAVKEVVGRTKKTVGYTCALSGTPAKAGVYRVTFKQKDGTETRVTEEELTVSELPTWAYGKFTGWSASDGDDFGDVGAASLTVTAAGKVSGSVTVRGKKWTFSAVGYDVAPVAEDGAFEVTVTARNGRSGRDIRVRISPDAFGGCSYAELCGEGVVAGLRRTVWGDKPAQWKIAKAKFGLDGLGCPDVTASVAASGKVTFAGKMPDGRKASGSSTASVAEDGSCHAYLIVPWKADVPGLLLDVPIPEAEVTR